MAGFSKVYRVMLSTPERRVARDFVGASSKQEAVFRAGESYNQSEMTEPVLLVHVWIKHLIEQPTRAYWYDWDTGEHLV